MTTVLIIAILIVALASIAVSRSSRPQSKKEMPDSLPPPPNYRGLFAEASADEPSDLSLKAARDAGNHTSRAAEIRGRALRGEKDALRAAHESGLAGLYDEVLETLVAQSADSRDKSFDLARFIADSHLSASASLAGAVLSHWAIAPNARSTADALHIAALSDDAEVYGRAVEAVLRAWREGRLAGLSADDLSALVESQFWLLAPEARNSGQGFVLKRDLAAARRELRAAARRA